MNERLTAAKTGIAVCFSAMTAFLGWRGILALVWVACMALDYISGSAAACKEGQWNSQRAREGLWHKLGMVIAVIVAVMADLALATACRNLPLGIDWPQAVLPLVLAWYIITELGSVLENAVKMGAAVPGWLVKLMKASLKAVDQTGDKNIPA